MRYVLCTLVTQGTAKLILSSFAAPYATKIYSVSYMSSKILNGIVYSQECSSTFKVYYLHFKYPCLCSMYVVTMPYLIVSVL